jgi:hypothetical protein
MVTGPWAGDGPVPLRGTGAPPPHKHARGLRDRPQGRWGPKSNGRSMARVRCSASNVWLLSRATNVPRLGALVTLITPVLSFHQYEE